MLIITRESVRELKEKLRDCQEIARCKAEINRMLEIKGGLLWRAEAGSSCACVGWQLPVRLAAEVQLLEEIATTLESGDVTKATSLLENYAVQLEEVS